MSTKITHPGWGGRRPGAGRKKIFKESKDSKKNITARSYMRKKRRSGDEVSSDHELSTTVKDVISSQAAPESLEYQVLVALLHLKESPSASPPGSPNNDSVDSMFMPALVGSAV